MASLVKGPFIVILIVFICPSRNELFFAKWSQLFIPMPKGLLIFLIGFRNLGWRWAEVDRFHLIFPFYVHKGVDSHMAINAAEFRANCFKILDEVKLTHRKVVISKRGGPIAKLLRLPGVSCLGSSLRLIFVYLFWKSNELFDGSLRRPLRYRQLPASAGVLAISALISSVTAIFCQKAAGQQSQMRLVGRFPKTKGRSAPQRIAPKQKGGIWKTHYVSITIIVPQFS